MLHITALYAGFQRNKRRVAYDITAAAVAASTADAIAPRIQSQISRLNLNLNGSRTLFLYFCFYISLYTSDQYN
jgi:hypothetical protein